MTNSPRYNPQQHANVCLLLEGTYPYIRGGVSTWVRQLIEGMPELTFSVVFIGGKAEDYDEPVYELPDNLVHLETHFLLSEGPTEPRQKRWWSRKPDKSAQFADNHALHDTLAESQGSLDPSVAQSFATLLSGPNALEQEDLFHGDDAWTSIRNKYQDAPAGMDFNHFFWTVRTMHAPLFVLSNIAKAAPPADLYHSVSTGYAGYLGTLLKNVCNTPYIISEHGIYTKERELDLAQVEWIPDDIDPFGVGTDDPMGYLRQVWIRFFHSLGKLGYSSADHVYTLFNGNRLRQLADGAREDSLTIIPNGVNVERFKAVRRPHGADVPPVIALIGRIVPIKDIKTFIRAIRIIKSRLPDAEAWLIGPQDEDPDYTAECMALSESLDLDDTIKFLGFQQMTDILPKVGLSVLTSVSEGQPLVVLEGYAAGIPTVTTDVGSCSELVYGVGEEDKAIGASGAVVPIANPAKFAEAAIELLTDKVKWHNASDAAIKRVEQYYDERQMLKSYRDIYSHYVHGAAPKQAHG